MSGRLRMEIQGAVQGVGFRPFVYRLASELGLAGWVRNDHRGVHIEVEGSLPRLERFREEIRRRNPPRARIESTSETWLESAGYRRFEILPSGESGDRSVPVLPDIAPCGDCLSEISDPANRRHRYPFTNCTHCGPRFSILRSLPYDRHRTTMERFAMCPSCRREYEDPSDRRFHAQPNACPACGPALALIDPSGKTLSRGEEALQAAVTALGEGRIVAVKGLGGFHLMADARDAGAVRRLRERKPRREKPFALMARDLDQVRSLCETGEKAEALLASPEAPILLLPRKPGAAVTEEVAPGNPMLGVMLPSTPLHHLILRGTGFPVVATSGNLSDEPICTDEAEARERLGGIADLFLIHDRPIQRHVDDSVAWILRGRPRLLRRARGFAPLPVMAGRELPVILAVGAHLKNTVALSVGRRIFVSQHIGDLETPESLHAFRRVIQDFLRLYGARPAAIAHDLHPDYLSTRWAKDGDDPDGAGGELLRGLPRIAVQHHHAHLAACMAEQGEEGTVLGVTWDGTGYGEDGTVWGGEFLLGGAEGFRRAAHFLPFRLPGGESAVREPRRSALALLWELEGEAGLERTDLPPVREFTPEQRRLLGRMLAGGINSPVTSSAGRLFDAVASLSGLRQVTSFEGQAAMALEHAADPGVTDAYPLEILAPEAGGSRLLDWRPTLRSILQDAARGTAAGAIAARFHNALVESMVKVAELEGEERVALAGGCFQNRRLVEGAARRLEESGFRVLLHRQVPPNDGCISLGQVAVAAARLAAGSAGEGA
jgi:hydrogenase maturation protein HypF